MKLLLFRRSRISGCSFCKPYLFCLFVAFLHLSGKAQERTVIDSIDTFSNNLSPGVVAATVRVNQFHFKKPDARRINFGLTGTEFHYVLLKINAIESLPDQYLSIDNTSIDTVMIYSLTANQSPILRYMGGELVKYNSDRNYVWHTVPLSTGSKPSYYLIALKSPQKNINIQYDIPGKDRLQKKYEFYDRIVFFYIGVASMIEVIILVAFALFRKKVFVAYWGYITCMSIWIMAHYGRLFPLLYPNIPSLNHIVKPVSSLLAGVFLLLVLKEVFDKKPLVKSRLTPVLNGTIYLMLQLAGLMFLLLIPNLDTVLKTLLILAWHVGLLVSMIAIVSTPLRFFKSGAPAKIFSLAMLIICITALIQLFANNGMINSYFISEHGMAMGSLLENSIMAFGLFYGLLVERKNKALQVLALEEQQSETLKKLILVQDIERKRIANDLHDNIGPLLAALKINFKRIINSKGNANGLVQKTESIIDDSIMEIRGIAHNLAPKGITSKGLINALNDYFESMQPLCKQSINFHHDVQSIFEPDMQVNIYRIICELVLNAVKHSDATIISVSLIACEPLITISIFDNGRGFHFNHDKTSLGLQSAESRVQYLKGKLNITSDPGKGTAIRIEVPL